jgi:hypothetical protein
MMPGIYWQPSLAAGDPVRFLTTTGTRLGPESGTVLYVHEGEGVVSISRSDGEIVSVAVSRIARVNIFGEATWPCCEHCDHEPFGRRDTGHTVSCDLCPHVVPVHPVSIPGWVKVADLAADLMVTAYGDPAKYADRKGFIKGIYSVTLHMGEDGPSIACKLLRDEIAKVTGKRH